MSKISLTPNASGTGTLSIASPSTNSDYTLTLPAETGNVVVTDGTTLVVDNATDKVGVGTALGLIAPLTVQAQTQSTSTPLVYLRQGGSSPSYGYVFKIDNSSTGNLFLRRVGAGDTEGSDLVTLTPDGNLLVGTTSASGLLTCIGSTAAGYAGYFTGNYTASNNANIMFWGRNGGAVAAAVRYKDSGTSMEFYSPTGHTVAYTTSSDYRLKENVAPMTGALATVAQLKPVTYTWKEGFGTGQSQGFIAHELQAVVPDCVTGEKDAVETYTDEEGNEQTRPVYQGVDTSFLVATLTAAIQELSAKNDALEARIAALEAA